MPPFARVLYLLATAVGVFFLKDPWHVGALFVLQLALWPIVRLPLRKLARHLTKLAGIATFIVVSYAIVSEDPALDQWLHVPILSWTLALNVYGVRLGALMILRLVTVVLASQIASAGDSRAIAKGLSTLGVPKVMATSLDAVLSLLASDVGTNRRGMGGGRGHGDGGGRGGNYGGGSGGGGGRGRGNGDRRGAGGGTTQPGAGEGFWASFKRLSRGDVSPIAARLNQHIDNAQAHLDANAELNDPPSSARSRDIAVIAGATVSMLGIRALKILPSIPFAPGHKLVLLTPLYIVAALKTRTRLGGSLTGLTMGTVAFLMGDGKYGIFELVKHVAPGVICDLFLPLFGDKLGAVGWSLFGGFIALGRFATLFVVTLLLQAPGVAYALLLPGLTVHVTFGVLSGYVTHHLVRAMQALPGNDSHDKDAA
ncbi:MAG: hypothetical protein ACT4TC_05930 [Myxococcaceae bacterium]